MRNDHFSSSPRRTPSKHIGISYKTNKLNIHPADERLKGTRTHRCLTSTREAHDGLKATEVNCLDKIKAREELLSLQASILSAIELEHQLKSLGDLLLLYLGLDNRSPSNGQRIRSLDKLEEKLEQDATFRTWSMLHTNYVSRIGKALRTIEQNPQMQEVMSKNKLHIPGYLIWSFDRENQKTLDICYNLDRPPRTDEQTWQMILGMFIDALTDFVSSLTEEAIIHARKQRECMGRLIESGIAVESKSNAPNSLKARIREEGRSPFMFRMDTCPKWDGVWSALR